MKPIAFVSPVTLMWYTLRTRTRALILSPDPVPVMDCITTQNCSDVIYSIHNWNCVLETWVRGGGEENMCEVAWG